MSLENFREPGKYHKKGRLPTKISTSHSCMKSKAERISQGNCSSVLQVSPGDGTDHISEVFLIRKEDTGVLISHTVFFSHWLRLSKFFPICFLCFGEGDQNRTLAVWVWPSEQRSKCCKQEPSGWRHACVHKNSKRILGTVANFLLRCNREIGNYFPHRRFMRITFGWTIENKYAINKK